MSDFYSNAGKVVKGDYEGYYFFILNYKTEKTCFLEKYPKIEISYNTVTNVDGTGFLRTRGRETRGSFTQFLNTTPQKINKQTVDSYRQVSATEGKTSVNGANLIKGALIGGFVLGLAAGLTSDPGKYIYAVYFKNKKKSLIEVDDAGKEALETLLFDF